MSDDESLYGTIAAAYMRGVRPEVPETEAAGVIAWGRARGLDLHRFQALEGSRLQPGDKDLDAVPFRRIRGRLLVVEEKLDGANCAIGFSEAGEVRLQSRGHYLDGGSRERQFDLMKSWAASHRDALWPALGARYTVYGEWLYANWISIPRGMPPI